MKNWMIAAAVAMVPLGIAASVGAFYDDPPTIKAVMGKLHKGTKSQTSALKTQLKSETPDWEAIQKITKDFVILGAALEKNDPPKGDKDSWKKLADKYFANAKAIDDAATAKDKDKLQAATKAMGASCKACHDVHKDD